MISYDFPELSDQATVWIYGFSKILSVDDQRIVKDALDVFVSSWKSHGSEVTADYKMIYDRFVLIAVQNPEISGCSIDSSVKVFKNLKHNHELDALNLNQVYFRDQDTIKSVTRPEFNQLVKDALISFDTIVFDLTVNRLSGIRAGEFEKPARDSWHAQLLQPVA
jgi:hypothetical protein